MKSYLLLLGLLMFCGTSYGKCKAILVNGGFEARSNYRIHETQLREMYNSLVAQGCKDKDIYVFSGSGSTTAKDFRADPVAADSALVPMNYEFNKGKTVANLYAADKETLKSKIAEISKGIKSDDSVFVYLNDHGSKTAEGEGALVPWSVDPRALFTTEDLEKAISQAPDSAKFKVWADCCYCGAFNKLDRKNTCVATATDQFHVGNYFWSNWTEYSKAGGSKGPIIPTVKAAFAGEIKNKSSFLKAAQTSRLSADDVAFDPGMMQPRCFVGPQDSAEFYMFKTLGYENKKVCFDDIYKAVDGVKGPTANRPLCEADDAAVNVQNLRDVLAAADKNSPNMSSAEKQRIRNAIKKLDQGIAEVNSSDYDKKLNELEKQFEALSPLERVHQAQNFQSQASRIRKQYFTSTAFFPVYDEQKSVIKALFLAKATPEQKKEYERRRACLQQPIL